MSKVIESSTATIACLAIMFHVEQYQDVDKDTEVKYPTSTYVDYKTFVENKCEVPKEGNVTRNKVFILEPKAIDETNKIFKDSFTGTLKEMLKDNKESFSDFKTLRKEAYGLPKVVFDIGEKVNIDDEFLKDIEDQRNRLSDDIFTRLKAKGSAKSKDKSSSEATDIDSDVKEKVVNAVIAALFAIGEVLAGNLMFNSATTTSKLVSKEMIAAFMYIAKKYSKLDSFYDALIEAGLRIETKVIKPKAVSTAGAKSKSKTASSKATKNAKSGISDDEEDEDDAPKKTSKRGNKKPAKEDDSDSDAQDSDNE